MTTFEGVSLLNVIPENAPILSYKGVNPEPIKNGGFGKSPIKNAGSKDFSRVWMRKFPCLKNPAGFV